IPTLPLGFQSISTSGTSDGYASYSIVLTSQMGASLSNDNVLGQPTGALLNQTDDTDFAAPGRWINGQLQPFDASVGTVPYVPAPGAAAGMSFLLVGPPALDARRTIVAGPVPG